MKLAKLTFNGITWGCTICTFILVCIAANCGDTFSMNSDMFIKHIMGSVFVGIGFTVPSLIYDQKKLSMKVQTLIHMGCGFGVYLPIACSLGWLPVTLGFKMVILPLAFAIIFAIIIWLGFYLYYKHEAKRINEKLNMLH